VAPFLTLSLFSMSIKEESLMNNACLHINMGLVLFLQTDSCVAVKNGTLPDSHRSVRTGPNSGAAVPAPYVQRLECGYSVRFNITG
jgi:hypothetical protein